MFFSAVILYLLFAFMWAYLLIPQLVSRYTDTIENASELTPSQIQIVKKVEDPSFDTNIGVDMTTAGQGATTITQSLARDIYLNQKVDGLAGVPQSIFKLVFNLFKKIDLGRDVMALALHARVSREELLYLFINKSYLGNSDHAPVYGLQSAAKTYYEKDANQLTEFEFITLVAMLDAPEKYHVQDQHEANTDRSLRIQKILRNECRPAGLLDNEYKLCG